MKKKFLSRLLLVLGIIMLLASNKVFAKQELLKKSSNANLLVNATEKITITWHCNAQNAGTIQTTENKNAPTTIVDGSDFYKPGHIFINWNTESDGTGTSYEPLQVVEEGFSDDIHLYEPITYYIAFNANGGTGEMTTIEATYNQPVSLPENGFTREDYTFRHWGTTTLGGTAYNELDEVQNLADEQGEVVTLYAQWWERFYVISFDKNGGSGSDMGTKSCKFNSSITLLGNEYTHLGARFAGWNTKADGTGTHYEEFGTYTQTVHEDVTLYAEWESLSYRVNYNANGGTGKMTDLINNSEFGTVYYETTPINILENEFTREGYFFKNWNTKADGTGVSYNGLDSMTYSEFYATHGKEVTLYAQWSPNTYSVSFDANGGLGTMSGFTIDYDSSRNLPENKFTKSVN